MERIEEYLHIPKIHLPFSNLIHLIKNTKLLGKYYDQIETLYVNLLKTTDNYTDRSCLPSLINRFKNTELLEKNYSVLLEAIDKLSDTNKPYAHYQLLKRSKDIIQINQYYEQIKAQFLLLLDNFDNLPDNSKPYSFSVLLKVSEELGLIQNQYPIFVALMDKLPDSVKKYALEDLKKYS